MATPEQFEDIVRTYNLAVKRGTEGRGVTQLTIQTLLTDLGIFVGISMNQRGDNLISLAARASLQPDDIVAIKYGIGTLEETRSNLPKIAQALGFSQEDVDARIMRLLYPESYKFPQE